jgi:hypothetical protein
MRASAFIDGVCMSPDTFDFPNVTCENPKILLT